MNTESVTPKVRSYSDTVIKQFHPIVAQFGFTQPEWDYDEETEVVRVQFENPVRGNAVQIDYHLDDSSYHANYLQNGGGLANVHRREAQEFSSVESYFVAFGY